jgi:hypothetical protein
MQTEHLLPRLQQLVTNAITEYKLGNYIESVGVARFSITFHGMLFLKAMKYYLEVGAPSTVGCSQVLIQHICNNLPHFHPQFENVPFCRDKVLTIKVNLNRRGLGSGS